MSKSKQINFFAIPNDWPQIDKFLLSQDLIMFRKLIFENTTQFPENLLTTSVSSSHQVYLSKNEFKPEIFFKKYNHGFSIDVVKSNVIEFSRGGYYGNSENVLHRARLYSTTKFYQENVTIEKSEKFVSWVDAIFKSFKKEFLIKTKYDDEILLTKNTVLWAKEKNAILHDSGLTFSYNIPSR